MLSSAIENFSELFGYIATGRVNIRIHKEGDPPPLLSCESKKRGRERPAGKQDVVWCGVIYLDLLKVSVDTMKRFTQRISQLYEQGADSVRIVKYVMHWLKWVRTGVLGVCHCLFLCE